MPSLIARLRAVAVAAVALVALAGCGAEAGPVAQAVEMREVTDIEGTVMQVPVAPQRVVTLSEPALDGALALGVTPIGTTSGRGQSRVAGYLSDLAGDIPILGGVAQPNFEAIGSAQPDLIIVDGTSINNNPPVIEVLRQIAPVYYAGYAGGDWRMTFRNIADALNLADQADGVIAGYEAHAAEVKGRLGDYLSSTFSIVRWQGTSAALILLDLPPGQALQDIGLARPENQNRRGRGHSEPVSLENIAQIDADYMFFGTLGGSSIDNPNAGGATDVSGAREALAQAEGVPGFAQLRAFRDHHIIPVDGSLWTSTGGPLLMMHIVDDVQRTLVDG